MATLGLFLLYIHNGQALRRAGKGNTPSIPTSPDLTLPVGPNTHLTHPSRPFLVPFLLHLSLPPSPPPPSLPFTPKEAGSEAWLRGEVEGAGKATKGPTEQLGQPRSLQVPPTPQPPGVGFTSAVKNEKVKSWRGSEVWRKV